MSENVSNESTQLHQATERLYRVFGKYAPAVDTSDDRGLREMDAEDLIRAGCADLTKLGTRDLRRFIPRVLELLIAGEYPVRAEIVLGSLANADWRRWQKNEQSAIERFLFAGWRYLLSVAGPIERVDQWLCASMQILDDSEEFIQELTNEWWQPLPKAAHYARLVNLNYDALADGRQLANPHWVGREEQMQKAVRWLAGDYEINDLDKIISEHPYEPISDDLRLAANHLENLCKLPHKERLKPPIPNPPDFVREPRNHASSGVEPIAPTPECLEALTAAIETLYEVFEPYPSSFALACDAPLRELTQSDLADFARDALIASGQPEDFKHFLPRIFELMLQPGWPVRPEGSIFKLLLADFFMWPEAERLAVEDYVKAVWRVLLCDADYPVSAEEWLCAASSVIGEEESGGEPGESYPIEGFIDLAGLWRQMCYEGSTPAMIHWARFIVSNHETLLDGLKMRNRFWAPRPGEVKRAVYWMVSAESVAGYLRGENAGNGVPEEVERALTYANALWKKMGQMHRGTAYVAIDDPAKALELARGIEDPWFRCQELAGVAGNTSDTKIRDTALRESFAAGVETAQPNRIAVVSTWPLRVLLEFELFEWCRQELTRLVEVMCTEPHPYRRIDALIRLLAPAFRSAPELYPEIIAEIGRAAEEAHGWKVAYLLLIGSELANDFDHAGAIEIAMMIRNLRTRRRALRAIGEREMAEKYY